MESQALKRRFVSAGTMLPAVTLLALAGCGGKSADSGSSSATTAAATPPLPIAGVNSTPIATFTAPWSMAFLPDQRVLVTERVTAGYVPGNLWIAQAGASSIAVSGAPANVGLLDIALHPLYRSNGIVYFTFLEAGGPNDARVGAGAADAGVPSAGIALASATLVTGQGTAQLQNVKVIWRQAPKIVSLPGSGEPGGRIAFSPDGAYVFVTAGDRQEMAPVQSLDNTLGKIIRLRLDGSVPADNPFVGKGGALPEIYTLGHRNPYGLAFDANGLLWENEMGPMGGDELNLIEAGGNYGWPNVSYGSAYSGEKYPDPKPGDGYVQSAYQWTPVIAPSGMIFSAGDMFGAWKKDAIIPGLKSQLLVRIHFNGLIATEAQRVPMGARIRAIAQAADGAIWVLEDAPTGRLLRLMPIF